MNQQETYQRHNYKNRLHNKASKTWSSILNNPLAQPLTLNIEHNTSCYIKNKPLLDY